MMRNKYTIEFENLMRNKAIDHSFDELYKIAKRKYKITRSQLMQYLSKRKIRYKDYMTGRVRQMGLNYQIGCEYVKNDGMVLVKIAKDKWEYKQRLLYMKYHNCELTSDDYIIFLNQDRTDFSKENLAKVTRHESAFLSNQQMFSKKRELTKLGIDTAKLMIKIKDLPNKKSCDILKA